MNLNLSPSFIEICDKALSSNECNILISQFKNHPNRGYGKVYNKHGVKTIDKDIKNSFEIYDLSFSESTVITSIISNSLNKCFDRYRKKYPVINDYMPYLEYYDLYTFKKFEGKNGGYKAWHHEQGPSDVMSKRVLVWAFYLNDAAGTDFMFHPNVSGKEGRCVIFPASFNYMHRSAPNKGIKYYVSGWISYA
tara:strand:- start:429 stop:1007 length:579 start_codon:yes stop_codon:yes gene_type:complete